MNVFVEKYIQLFRERLSLHVYKRGKAYATMSKVIMGNGGFNSCLIGRIFLLPFSLLLNHFELQSSKTKLLLPIMLIGIVAYAFTVLWDNLRRNSCIYHAILNLFRSLSIRKSAYVNVCSINSDKQWPR